MKNFLLYFLNETKSILGNVQIKNACDWGDGPQPHSMDFSTLVSFHILQTVQ